MQGSAIKKKLMEAGFVLAKVAALIGESPQNLNILLRAKDVKTGTIERICKAINKSIDFFYSEKEYQYLLPKIEVPGLGEMISLKKYEEKVEECALLKAELEAVKEWAARYAEERGAYFGTTSLVES